eukprot:14436826-Alexandrium_andersonii.AAC.1
MNGAAWSKPAGPFQWPLGACRAAGFRARGPEHRHQPWRAGRTQSGSRHRTGPPCRWLASALA